ncbi:MAG: sulfatase-like hydrolase/transferase, partial [Bacteroidota bacterium]
DFYYTEAIGDSAVTFVEQFHQSKTPFFLYLAHCAPHWPLQAPEATIKKYEDRYKAGWQALRKERYTRMVDLGLLDSTATPLTPFMFPKLDWQTHKDTVWDARAMAVHAAMVEEMDKSIGKLLDKLKATGELDNTLILFFSDNGASSERPSKYGPGFDRAGSTRTGETVHFPVDKSTNHLPGPQTVHAGIGPQWAHAINTPFRLWKARVFEGGINSPCIVHWPKGLSAKGEIRSQAAHIIDLMPTFLELAKVSYPDELDGKKLTPIEGNSILPILKNTSMEDSQKSFFWEHMGAAALRQGDWKLVRERKNSDWELYNIKKDRTEQNNLAEQYPNKLTELAEKWEQLAYQYKAFPAPN